MYELPRDDYLSNTITTAKLDSVREQAKALAEPTPSITYDALGDMTGHGPPKGGGGRNRNPDPCGITPDEDKPRYN